jgi:hypothetical protein
VSFIFQGLNPLLRAGILICKNAYRLYYFEKMNTNSEVLHRLFKKNGIAVYETLFYQN